MIHYGVLVKVIAGFYIGCFGVVNGFNDTRLWFSERTYRVVGKCKLTSANQDYGNFDTYLPESILLKMPDDYLLLDKDFK